MNWIVADRPSRDIGVNEVPTAKPSFGRVWYDFPGSGVRSGLTMYIVTRRTLKALLRIMGD
jgi:hypothetical protein